jgi:ABC-type dipeptide/oligopeptide/nickel transport system permease component
MGLPAAAPFFRKEDAFMLKHLLKRLILLAVTLILVTVLAFVAFSIIPGDPTDAILGLNATEAQIAAHVHIIFWRDCFVPVFNNSFIHFFH